MYAVNYHSEDMAGLVGPFETRKEADAWAHRQRPSASWNVVPLAVPDTGDTNQTKENDQ